MSINKSAVDNPAQAKWGVSTDTYNFPPLLSSVFSSFYPSLRVTIDSNIVKRLR